jgi:beta-lactamase class A
VRVVLAQVPADDPIVMLLTRPAIVASLTFTLLVPPAADAATATSSLTAMLSEAVAAFPGEASVVVADPRTAFRFTALPDRVLPSASLYKLGLMVEAYRQSATGELSLDVATVQVDEEDVGDDDYFTPPGTTLSVREAIERTITFSDNSPARALLRLLDPHRVNDTLRRLGLRSTRINVGLPPDEQTDSYNTTSARDLELLFAGLIRGSVVGRPQSAEMIGILQRQKIADRLPAGLPAGAIVAHKTGNLDEVAHDAGIIYTTMGPRIAVVLTSAYRSYDDVIALNERVAALTYEAQLDDFAARYQTLGEPPQPAPPIPLEWSLQVTNASSFTWQSSTYLRAQLQEATSEQPEMAWRLPLPALAPGGAASIPVVLPALRPGIYLLMIEVYDVEFGTSGNRLPIVFEVRR